MGSHIPLTDIKIFLRRGTPVSLSILFFSLANGARHRGVGGTSKRKGCRGAQGRHGCWLIRRMGIVGIAYKHAPGAAWLLGY